MARLRSATASAEPSQSSRRRREAWRARSGTRASAAVSELTAIGSGWESDRSFPDFLPETHTPCRGCQLEVLTEGAPRATAWRAVGSRRTSDSTAAMCY